MCLSSYVASTTNSVRRSCKRSTKVAAGTTSTRKEMMRLASVCISICTINVHDHFNSKNCLHQERRCEDSYYAGFGNVQTLQEWRKLCTGKGVTLKAQCRARKAALYFSLKKFSQSSSVSLTTTAPESPSSRSPAASNTMSST